MRPHIGNPTGTRFDDSTFLWRNCAVAFQRLPVSAASLANAHGCDNETNADGDQRELRNAGNTGALCENAGKGRRAGAAQLPFLLVLRTVAGFYCIERPPVGAYPDKPCRTVPSNVLTLSIALQSIRCVSGVAACVGAGCAIESITTHTHTQSKRGLTGSKHVCPRHSRPPGTGLS